MCFELYILEGFINLDIKPSYSITHVLLVSRHLASAPRIDSSRVGGPRNSKWRKQRGGRGGAEEVINQPEESSQERRWRFGGRAAHEDDAHGSRFPSGEGETASRRDNGDTLIPYLPIVPHESKPKRRRWRKMQCILQPSSIPYIVLDLSCVTFQSWVEGEHRLFRLQV